MPDKHIHIGDRSILATGNVEVVAQGTSAILAAPDTEGSAFISAGSLAMVQSGAGFLTIAGGDGTADVALQSSPTGTITIALGPMELGPCIKLSAEQIQMTVGPPGAGASITMTPASIMIKVGVATYEMTPASISEEIAPTSRELSPAGHTLTSAESEYGLTPAGESVDVPTSSLKAMASAQIEGTATAAFQAAAEATVKGAICMIN
jgi:hypothetical protein